MIHEARVDRVTLKRAVILLAATLAALVLASGVALAATVACQAGPDCLGTKKADTLLGSAGDDDVFGRGGADTLKGRGGSDYLLGQGGRDTLLGGTDGDYLMGGPGDDLLAGGDNGDQYYFGSGWGEDSLTEGGTGPGDWLVFRLSPSDPVPVTENLIINLTPGPGPEARDEDGANTVDLDSERVEIVASGDGDDEISGNSLANVLYGAAGKDIIRGAAGDDYIYGNAGQDTIVGGRGSDSIHAEDGFGGDKIDCGEDPDGTDDDTVYYDFGDVLGINCEHKIVAT
jgi:Ca2+-binding RTX toxin-like protein